MEVVSKEWVLLEHIRDVLVVGIAGETRLYISPADANGRRVVVEIRHCSSGPGAGHRDFGYVVAEIRGLRVGRKLKVRQIDYSKSDDGFWRELGIVKSNRQFRP